MPDELIIAEEVRAYLIEEGAVSAAEGEYEVNDPPPCHHDPRDGALETPVPDGADATVTLLTGVEVPQEWLVGDKWQTVAIEVIVRAYSRPQADLLQRQLRGLLEEKRDITFGRLHVNSCKLWRGVQPVAADESTWTLSQSFLIDVSISKLTV